MSPDRNASIAYSIPFVVAWEGIKDESGGPGKIGLPVM